MLVIHWDLPVALQGKKAQKKYFIRWSHTAKAFGIEDIVLIDVDGIAPIFGDQEINLAIVKNLREAMDIVLNSNCVPVYVEQGGCDIRDFKHPENAAYIFGSDFGGLEESTVSFKSNIGINAEIACGIILEDRFRQWH